jgi:hypothetical protein
VDTADATDGLNRPGESGDCPDYRLAIMADTRGLEQDRIAAADPARRNPAQALIFTPRRPVPADEMAAHAVDRTTEVRQNTRTAASSGNW